MGLIAEMAVSLKKLQFIKMYKIVLLYIVSTVNRDKFLKGNLPLLKAYI